MHGKGLCSRVTADRDNQLPTTSNLDKSGQTGNDEPHIHSSCQSVLQKTLWFDFAPLMFCVLLLNYYHFLKLQFEMLNCLITFSLMDNIVV